MMHGLLWMGVSSGLLGLIMFAFIHQATIMQYIANPQEEESPSVATEPFDSSTIKIDLGRYFIQAKIVTTERDQEQGLSDVIALGAHEGMWFAWAAEGQRSIWMKDMFIPLDIIWLDKNKKVVLIEKNIQPPKMGTQIDKLKIYGINTYAQYVLEVNAGVVQQAGIKVGDTIRTT